MVLCLLVSIHAYTKVYFIRRFVGINCVLKNVYRIDRAAWNVLEEHCNELYGCDI
jgi:hypothetical protein